MEVFHMARTQNSQTRFTKKKLPTLSQQRISKPEVTAISKLCGVIQQKGTMRFKQ
jgi:hypothetical protein